MFKFISRIKERNGIFSTIIILLLIGEKSNIFAPVLKIIRVLFIQPIFNIQISPGNFTREGLLTLRLPHPYMIIIHSSSQIGKNCTIYHEVTIGCVEQISQHAPMILDNVYIGCKSVLLGETNIGNNSRIGAASVVLKSASIHAL